MKDIDNIGNKEIIPVNTDIINIDQEYPIENSKSFEREQKFLELLGVYKDHHEAARQAGYSESYAKTITQKLNRPSFQRKLKEYYKNKSARLLPAIIQAEATAVFECVEDVNKISKFKSTLKEIKQAAEVLQSDVPQQGMTVIQVNNLRELMVGIHQKVSQERPE